jgi:hypothetical protein
MIQFNSSRYSLKCVAVPWVQNIINVSFKITEPLYADFHIRLAFTMLLN